MGRHESGHSGADRAESRRAAAGAGAGARFQRKERPRGEAIPAEWSRWWRVGVAAGFAGVAVVDGAEVAVSRTRM
jgi:hypothetical protein